LSKNIIIKEPNGSFAADVIAECLPDSKIIVLIRDGRDVLDSRFDMHKPGSWAVFHLLEKHIVKIGYGIIVPYGIA